MFITRWACMQPKFTSPSAYAASRVLRVHHIATRPQDAAPKAAPTATTEALAVKAGCCDTGEAVKDMSSVSLLVSRLTLAVTEDGATNP